MKRSLLLMVCRPFDSIAFALFSSDAKLLIKVKLLSVGLSVMFLCCFLFHELVKSGDCANSCVKLLLESTNKKILLFCHLLSAAKLKLFDFLLAINCLVVSCWLVVSWYFFFFAKKNKMLCRSMDLHIQDLLGIFSTNWWNKFSKGRRATKLLPRR